MKMSVQKNGSSAHPTIQNLDEFTRRFDPMVEEWRAHDGKDLTIRHKTGKLLNEFMGPPMSRAKRGEGVALKAGQQLGITKSEVSRLRWFAYFFNSVEDLKKDYKEATSWSAVKGLIPVLKEEAKSRSPAKEGGHGDHSTSGSADKMKDRKSKQMGNYLDRLSDAFNEVHEHLNKVELSDLQNKIRAFLDKVRNTYFSKDSQNVRVEAGA